MLQILEEIIFLSLALYFFKIFLSWLSIYSI